jgi:hypothetical protein
MSLKSIQQFSGYFLQTNGAKLTGAFLSSCFANTLEINVKIICKLGQNCINVKSQKFTKCSRRIFYPYIVLLWMEQFFTVYLCSILYLLHGCYCLLFMCYHLFKILDLWFSQQWPWRVLSCWMWHCVHWHFRGTYASIFRVEE